MCNNMSIKSNNRTNPQGVAAVNIAKTSFHNRVHKPGDRGVVLYKGGLLLGALMAVTGVVQAQSLAGNPSAPVDDTLTWRGITLYGIIDIGLQYETHGAPFSDYHPAGSANIVQKNSRQSVVGATPSNLSQSRVGLQGLEPVIGDWSAVFKVETFFNPQSGQISDAEKSMVLNNGKSPGQQTTNLDSSVAGQAFETAYLGMSNKQFGALTFGRQTTPLADGISKYDPNYASQAFSLIGMSGTYAGGGDTEDRRLDSSLKYVANFDGVHLSALYKFNGSNGAANTAFQLNVGGEFAGASVDAYYTKANSAVSAAPLSAKQVGELPTLGLSITNTLSGTISDNTTVAIMAMYNFDPFKFFAGYEHMQYANPSSPLSAGFTDIGGYVLAFVNNDAYPNDKKLQVYWTGVRYTVIPHLDLTVAYYGYHQNAYGTGDVAGCSTNVSGTCSGYFQAFSFNADYQLTKRFDAYLGAMYSGVKNGVANGYDFERTNINPTIGLRFKF
jgi:predicted porin